MSLLNKQPMTPASLTAHQANARRSHGPVTAEGVERIRTANLRHGFYSPKDDEALVALGEDPAELAALTASLMDYYAPRNPFEKQLVKRLSRAIWRMERADRIQESQAVLRVEEARRVAAKATRQIHDGHDVKLEALKTLAAEVARPDYFTNLDHVTTMDEVYGMEPTGQPGEILALLYRLALPGKGDMAFELRAAQIDPETDEVARQECQTELNELLAAEIAQFEAARTEAQEELWKYDSPFGYDALMAPQSSRDGLMMRMEDSNFRQICRITQMLNKLRSTTPVAASESEERQVTRDVITQNEGESGEVAENTE